MKTSNVIVMNLDEIFKDEELFNNYIKNKCQNNKSNVFWWIPVCLVWYFCEILNSQVLQA